MISCFSDVGHALRQFVLECMNLTIVDEDGRIYNPRGQQMDIPWDDQYPYYVGMIPTEKSPRVNSCKESTEALSQDQGIADVEHIMSLIHCCDILL